jgi:hypothetical protein
MYNKSFLLCNQHHLLNYHSFAIYYAPYSNLCECTQVEPQGRLLALLTVKRFTVLYAEQSFELQATVESFVLQTCVNRFTI